MNNKFRGYFIITIFGIILILAGIFHWPVPTINWSIRKTKYGEEINSFVMIFMGILLFVVVLVLAISTIW